MPSKFVLSAGSTSSTCSWILTTFPVGAGGASSAVVDLAAALVVLALPKKHYRRSSPLSSPSKSPPSSPPSHNIWSSRATRAVRHVYRSADWNNIKDMVKKLNHLSTTDITRWVFWFMFHISNFMFHIGYCISGPALVFIDVDASCRILAFFRWP